MRKWAEDPMRIKTLLVHIALVCLLFSSCGRMLSPDEISSDDEDVSVEEQRDEEDQNEELVFEEDVITSGEIVIPEEEGEVITSGQVDIPESEEDLANLVPPDATPHPDSEFVHLTVHIAGAFTGSTEVLTSDILEYDAETIEFGFYGSKVKGLVDGKYVQNREDPNCRTNSTINLQYKVYGWFLADCSLELLFVPKMDPMTGHTEMVCNDGVNYSGWGFPSVNLYFPAEPIQIEFKSGEPAIVSGEEVIQAESLLDYHWSWKVELFADSPVEFTVPVKTNTGDTVKCSVWIQPEIDPVLEPEE